MPNPKETSQTTAKAEGLSDGLTAAKRAQILAGAATIFMREGFAATSMEQIAKEAGVSKGTLYNHFASKQALFSTIIESECAKIQEQVFDLTEMAGEPKAVLMKVGISFLSSVLDPHAMSLYRNMIAESQRFPELGHLFMQSGPNAGSRTLGKYLRRMTNEGLLSIQDEVRAAHQFIALCDAGMVNHAHLLADKPTTQYLRAHVASAVHVFLKAYGVQPCA
jgi:TetR/AcrR family transcriptional regulator, mexJK operon transcriptional repressor